MGVPKHLILLLKNFYKNNSNVIRIDCTIQTEPFVTKKKGIRQECILSPLLFNRYSECVIRQILDGLEGVSAGDKKINFRYEDDTTLVAKNVTKMQTLLHRLHMIRVSPSA